MTLRGWTWHFWQIDLAGATVAASVLAVLYFWGLAPTIESHEIALEKQQMLREELQEAARLDRKVDALTQRLEQTREALEATPLHLEPLASMNRRLAALAELAEQCRLRVNAIEPGPATAGTHYQTVAIDLSGNGSYSDCARFIHRLRGQFPDTGVESMEITANPQQPREAVLRFQLHWHASPAPGGREVAQR